MCINTTNKVCSYCIEIFEDFCFSLIYFGYCLQITVVKTLVLYVKCTKFVKIVGMNVLWGKFKSVLCILKYKSWFRQVITLSKLL